jgi:hypothetical protein
MSEQPSGHQSAAGPFAITVAEFLERHAEPREDLIERLLAPGELGVVAGEPKAFKSWLGIDLAVSVATGDAVAGQWQVSRPGPTLLIQEENRDDELASRFRARLARCPEPGAVPALIRSNRGTRLDDPATIRALIAMIETERICLVVLDPLYRLHGAEENDATEMGRVIEVLLSIRNATGAAIVLIHHVRKRERERERGRAPVPVSGADLRGSNVLHAVIDAGIYLTRHPDDPYRVSVNVERRSAPAGQAELVFDPETLALRPWVIPHAVPEAPVTPSRRRSQAPTSSPLGGRRSSVGPHEPPGRRAAGRHWPSARRDARFPQRHARTRRPARPGTDHLRPPGPHPTPRRPGAGLIGRSEV